MQFKHQPLDTRGMQIHRHVVGRDIHLANQQPDNPHLLGREQLVSDIVEPLHGHRDDGLVQGWVVFLGLRQNISYYIWRAQMAAQLL